MKMKKLGSLMMVGVLVGTMLVGCGKGSSSETKDAKKEGSSDAMKVSLLCVGNLGDKGFNDSAAKGMERMEKEMGAETKIIELGRDESSYEGNFFDVSEQGYDLIISGTWSAKEVIEQMSVEYPENKYLCFDCAVDRDVATEGNIMGITSDHFPEALHFRFHYPREYTPVLTQIPRQLIHLHPLLPVLHNRILII